jgi:hypothetical protein
MDRGPSQGSRPFFSSDSFFFAGVFPAPEPPLTYLQRFIDHANISTTSRYLQGTTQACTTR